MCDKEEYYSQVQKWPLFEYEKNYECEDCLQKFKSEEILSQHKKEHENSEKMYSCDKCPEAFYVLRALCRHELVAHSTKSWTCCVCPMVFGNFLDCRNHVKCHGFPCELCETAFKTELEFKDHFFSVHKPKPVSEHSTKKHIEQDNLTVSKVSSPNNKSCDSTVYKKKLRGTSIQSPVSSKKTKQPVNTLQSVAPVNACKPQDLKQNTYNASSGIITRPTAAPVVSNSAVSKVDTPNMDYINSNLNTFIKQQMDIYEKYKKLQYPLSALALSNLQKILDTTTKILKAYAFLPPDNKYYLTIKQLFDEYSKFMAKHEASLVIKKTRGSPPKRQIKKN